MQTTLDRFGRVVIPKQVRDDLGLKPGAVLEIEEVEQKIFLKPMHGEPHVVTKDGVLVFSGTAIGDIVGAIRSHRRERHAHSCPALAPACKGRRICQGGRPPFLPFLPTISCGRGGINLMPLRKFPSQLS